MLTGGPGSDTCPLQTGDARSSCTKASPVDPDDATGTADVQQMIIGFVYGSATWTFHTFASWTIKGIHDHLFFIVHVDTKGHASRRVLRADPVQRHQLIGELYKDAAVDDFVGALAVAKPAGGQARISIPFSRVDLAPTGCSSAGRPGR